MSKDTSLNEMAREAEDDTGISEVLTFRIEPHLMPDWSNLVERICSHHGEAIEVGMEGNMYVVSTQVFVDNKPGLMRDMANFWDAFVAKRKAEGRWFKQ